MSKSPYPGFTPLNNRRGELINKKFSPGGITIKEACELEMLQGVTSLMIEYAYPMGPNIARMKRLAEKLENMQLRVKRASKYVRR